jgi:hypothetical protein
VPENFISEHAVFLTKDHHCPGEGKATGGLPEQKITLVLKKRSDIVVRRVEDHHCPGDGAEKVKRLEDFRNKRSPLF